jgi:hypothetical protein
MKHSGKIFLRPEGPTITVSVVNGVILFANIIIAILANVAPQLFYSGVVSLYTGSAIVVVLAVLAVLMVVTATISDFVKKDHIITQLGMMLVVPFLSFLSVGLISLTFSVATHIGVFTILFAVIAIFMTGLFIRGWVAEFRNSIGIYDSF